MTNKVWFKCLCGAVGFITITAFTHRSPEPVQPFAATAKKIAAALTANHRAVAKPVVPLSASVHKYAKGFVISNAEKLRVAEGRSKNSFHRIESILQKHNLPVQLKYLAVVESGLRADALSHAGAVGYWQLMPQTARELGLKTGKWDERKNLQRSTQAVALYIKDLYRYYNDWLLVLAAYNAGPGNVDKAIRRSGSRNYWELQRYLPAETRGHVKHFIGTHMYFEPEYSVTVLTKAQAAAYKTSLQEYEAAQAADTSLMVSMF